jgi:hypothetical protein
MPKMRVRGIVLGSNIIRLDCPVPLSEGAAVEVVVDVHSSDNTNNPPRTGVTGANSRTIEGYGTRTAVSRRGASPPRGGAAVMGGQSSMPMSSSSGYAIVYPAVCGCFASQLI